MSGIKPVSPAPPVCPRPSPESSPSSLSGKDASPESGYSSSNSRDRASPESVSDARSSPELEDQPVKKLRRANYKPEQITTLEREFQENPYPDAERLEALSREIHIPESKLRLRILQSII